VKLYKYLPREYADLILNEGCFLFRSLSYFQDYEDDEVRGDRFEGVQKYSGKDGLEINNLTSGKASRENWIFKSKVDSENIFIFSASLIFSKELSKEFEADTCIEITDASKIISGLRSAVKRRRSVKPNKLFYGEVEYYQDSKEPGIDWAFPDRISNRKLNTFSHQKEYRFAFSTKNALKFGNTEQQVQMSDQPSVKRERPYPEKILKIGNIKQWCVVHDLT